MTRYIPIERESLRFIHEQGYKTSATGSRVIGGWTEQSDMDYLVYSPTLRRYDEYDAVHLSIDLEAMGWTTTVDLDKYGRPLFTDFIPMRKGNVNLIIACTPEFAKRHMIATRRAKAKGVTKKADRVAVFQEVLYGNVI